MRHRGPILKANSKKLDVKRRHNALIGLDRMQLFYMDINIVRMVDLFNHFKSAGLKIYIWDDSSYSTTFSISQSNLPNR
jgi:hypothetical protein